MDVAASAIAFVQAVSGIAKCIAEAKQLWDQVKDLPRELNDMIEDLKRFEPKFRDVEAQFNAKTIAANTDFWNAASAKDSLESSKQAHEILQKMVEELNSQLSTKKGLKKKIAAVKIIIKKSHLDRYEKRMNRAIQLLGASTTSFQTALLLCSPKAIARQVTADLLPHLYSQQVVQATSIVYHTHTHIYSSQGTQGKTAGCYNEKKVPECYSEKRIAECDNEKDLLKEGEYGTALTSRTKQAVTVKKEYTPSKLGRFALAYTKTTGAWQAYVQCPSWLSQSVYEVHSRPTISGWMYNYRVYNIVSRESEVIKRIENGDTDGVLELFSTRKASPFDKDERGYSLLHHAAQSKNYDICQILFGFGLQGLLDEIAQPSRRSPLTDLVHETRKNPKDAEWGKINQLFQSHINDPNQISVDRLFDFMYEWAYNDEFLFLFQEIFMPKYYTGPIRPRLEAVRLGSYHMKSAHSLTKLISKDTIISSSDISLSNYEKLSLVHSVAVALGIRYADEVLPYKRAQFQWRVYNDSWSDMVTQVASVAESQDLHNIETMSPWDVYHAPSWRGTPLISVIGGALCYLSPDISFFHWDMVFQETVRQWLEALQAAGIDLLAYGKREVVALREQKGALDAHAVESSRTQIRDTMTTGQTIKVQNTLYDKWTVNHWVPIRIIDLEIGPCAGDWKVVWAPEFEHMACQFWKTVEKENSIMPGSWVEG
ncbi:hypothetical protein G7046_g2294 [Stylonectria norvegica]|nr:hypothetical protein G7046_g2294 [Stylonectria norvegica]